MNRSDDRDKMIELLTLLTIAILKPVVIVFVAWQAWNFMPANKDRQIAIADALGATVLLSCITSTVRLTRPE